MQTMPLIGAALVGCWWALSAGAGDAFDNINSGERAFGPGATTQQSHAGSGASAAVIARIAVDAGQTIQRLTKLHYGACIEDLNHEIYGGLYAQMLYGESFEEGPDREPPDGWRWAGYVSPRWRGMCRFDGGVVTLTGSRWLQVVHIKQALADGVIRCEVMQPAYDPGEAARVIFRAGVIGERSNKGVGQTTAILGPYYSAGIAVSQGILDLRRGKDFDAGEVLAKAQVKLRGDHWYPLTITIRGGTIEVALEGGPTLSHADPAPLPAGFVGLEASNARARFRKLRVSAETDWPLSLETPPAESVSQWWHPIRTGEATAHFALDEDNPYNSRQAQRIEFTGGSGTIGLSNRGLNSLGLNVRQGHSYRGRLYVRGDAPGPITVALQNADGNSTYAKQELPQSSGAWQRRDFELTSSASDPATRFAVWIDKPGTIWLDQVVLMPTGDELFEGLPVRADIARAMVAQGITFLRFGGDYSGVPGWRWKNTVGDRDKRPQFCQPWYPFGSAGFGMDEFLRFCEAAGIEPAPTLNRFESPRDMADFVEYCNGPASGRWGAIRAKHGHPEPYKLKYVQIDNGFAGAEHTAAVADAVHTVDPNVRVLSGAITHHVDRLPPEQEMRKTITALSGKARALSVLPYNDRLGDASQFERLVLAFQEQIRRNDPAARLKLYSQEVNGGLHNLQRALADAQYLHVAERHAAFIEAVAYCNALQADGECDNGWPQGQILFNSRKVWLQPPALVLQMALRHFQPKLLASRVECATTEATAYPDDRVRVPVLSVSASADESGDVIVLKVANIQPAAQAAEIDLHGTEKIDPTAEVTILAGERLDLENSADEPSRVRPAQSTITNAASRFSYEFPRYSYTILRLKAAR